MSPQARRIVIPLVVGLVAFLIVLVVITAPGRSRTGSQRGPAATAPAQSGSADGSESPSAAPQQPANAAPPAAAQEESATAGAAALPLSGLHAAAPASDSGPRDQPPQSLGSLDPRRHVMRLELTRAGAGIASIAFSDMWQSARAKEKSHEYFSHLAPGEPIDFSKLDESQRYVLQTSQPYPWIDADGVQHSIDVPIMAAHSVIVNGTRVALLSADIWTESAPGTFETTILDESDRPLLTITREFVLGAAYDVTIRQRVINRSHLPLEVQWVQYGPVGLRPDPHSYIDRRRLSIGYLPDPAQRPTLVRAGSDFVFERSALLKQDAKAKEALKAGDTARHAELVSIWPNRRSRAAGNALSWCATTNRYFAMGIHPALDAADPPRALAPIVHEVRLDVAPHPTSAEPTIFTGVYSPVLNIEPEGQLALDMGLYAGPLDRHVLSQPPYSLVSMQGLILYQMAGCCTFLTFQWLAHALLWFLSFLHSITFDWGIAIIGLVIVVRTLLHPLTKKSQVSMQRFGRAMSAMKPEIDKLQKKFAGDPKRLQQEQMKLMREHGANPLQMLGCLPMVLQMPIWLALWAMLYHAFEIRQEPAFYGVFQVLGRWQFLADLSISDRFAVLPGGGYQLPLVGRLDAVNILPILMGIVFWIQQKYMTPPPSATMTPEQAQQQKIMKVMMVVMFPLFMYAAPSGLTLYILTSTCIGILESRYIRRHIDQIDPSPPGAGGGAGAARPKAAKKPRDRLGRMWADKLEAIRARRQADAQRTFKKRR